MGREVDQPRAPVSTARMIATRIAVLLAVTVLLPDPSFFPRATPAASEPTGQSPTAKGPGPAGSRQAAEPASTPAPTGEEGEAAEAAEESPGSSTAPPAAPETVWHVEGDSGVRYRLRSIPKSQGPYRRLDGRRVMFGKDSAHSIASEDDERFLVKVYEERRRGAGPRRAIDPAAVAATYRTEIGSADRLELRRFDRGLPDRGQWRNGLDVADMDGDGRLDLVVGPARKGAARPSIFLGDGRGEWRPLPGNPYPALPYDYGDVAVADFNGDGRPDLALAMHLRGAVVLVSDGNGRFVPWSRGIDLHSPRSGQPLTAFSSRRLVVADWNRDGRPDLVLMGEGPQAPTLAGRPGAAASPAALVSSRGLRVYLNQGNGAWDVAPLDLGRFPSRNFADALAVGDIDRDGRPDVLTGTRQVGNRWMVGYGEPDGNLVFAQVASLRPRALVLAVHLADLDRDGWVDAVLGYQSHEGVWRAGIDILWGGRDGWVRQGLLARESRSGITAVASGDLDGDGHLDIVGLDQGAGLFLFLGDGGRRFVAERSAADELPAPHEGCTGFAVRLRDLDGDGRDEILAAFAGEPAGFPGVNQLNQPGCPGGGSLRAWSPRLRAAPARGPDPPTGSGPRSLPDATRRP